MHTLTKRLLAWGIGIALILLIPLALTIRDGNVEGVGWNWSLFDFVFAGILMFGTTLAYELVSRRGGTLAYRAAVGIALAAAFLLVWINAAVGIIGDGDNGTSLLYFGVILVGIAGTTLARFRPRGMSRALLATAFAQAVVPAIALIAWPPAVTSWAPSVLGVFALNTFFAMLFAISALLFRHADKGTAA